MRAKWFVILLLVVGVSCTAAQAAWMPLSVNGQASGWSYRMADVFGGYVTVVADHLVDDVVTIEIQKEFVFPFDEQSLNGQAIWIDFRKTSENAVSIIEITDEPIWNSTGSDWYDFHMVVAGAIMAPGGNPAYVSFDPAYIFETNAQNPFQTIEYAPADADGGVRRLNMYDGVVAADASFWPGFDGSATNSIRIVTDMAVGEQFSLKEWPTVPEPATLGVLGFGLLFVARRRRRTA